MTIVNDVTAVLTAADARLDALAASNDQFAAESAALTAKNTVQADTIAQLNADKLALAAQVSTLTASVAAQAAQITTLTQTVAARDAEIAALKATTTPPVTPPATSYATLPSGWKLLWGDDFTGTAVDKAKWNVRDNTTQNNMDGRNFARNCTVKDSVLSIRSGADTGDTAKPWSCGYLDTNGKTAQNPQNGRWEARMRFPWGPTAVGFWPAFWLRPEDGKLGELDIMEAWPAKGDVHQSLWRDYGGTPHVEGKHQAIPPFDPTQWHVYAVEKETTTDASGKPKASVKFFVDGVLVWDATESATWVSEALARPVGWQVRLNLQMGGGYGGKPVAATNLAQTFDIDWVRVLTR